MASALNGDIDGVGVNAEALAELREELEKVRSLVDLLLVFSLFLLIKFARYIRDHVSEDASTHLYKRVCPSGRRPVRP